MKKLLGILPLCVVMAACGRAQQPPPFKAVVDTKTLMAALLEKQADIVWEAVGTTIEGNTVTDYAPKTDAEWANVRNAAVAVTESGNLLMIAPRAQDEGWMKASAGLIAQGERMLTAIDHRNPKEVFDVGSDLYDSCVACHMYYHPGIKDMYRRK